MPSRHDHYSVPTNLWRPRVEIEVCCSNYLVSDETNMIKPTESDVTQWLRSYFRVVMIICAWPCSSFSFQFQPCRTDQSCESAHQSCCIRNENGSFRHPQNPLHSRIKFLNFHIYFPQRRQAGIFGGFVTAEREQVEQLALQSRGDIRAALNSMQFFCCQGLSMVSLNPP